MKLHSRRLFANLDNKLEARKGVMSWTVQSMAEPHIDRMIFTSEDVDLLGAIIRPKAWPSFIPEVSQIQIELRVFNNWSVQVEEASTNKGETHIAFSAVRDDRRHSYVAMGYPVWLKDLLCLRWRRPRIR